MSEHQQCSVPPLPPPPLPIPTLASPIVQKLGLVNLYGGVCNTSGTGPVQVMAAWRLCESSQALCAQGQILLGKVAHKLQARMPADFLFIPDSSRVLLTPYIL